MTDRTGERIIKHDVKNRERETFGEREKGNIEREERVFPRERRKCGCVWVRERERERERERGT